MLNNRNRLVPAGLWPRRLFRTTAAKGTQFCLKPRGQHPTASYLRDCTAVPSSTTASLCRQKQPGVRTAPTSARTPAEPHCPTHAVRPFLTTSTETGTTISLSTRDARIQRQLRDVSHTEARDTFPSFSSSVPPKLWIKASVL